MNNKAVIVVAFVASIIETGSKKINKANYIKCL
jgi:hypothetical protein